MNLTQAKECLESIETELKNNPFVIAHVFERNGKKLHLGITERIRKLAKRGRVWKTPAFLTALKNAEYGFDETNSRSVSGADGIFLIDRNFKPQNQMMQKIFNRYLDKEINEIMKIAEALNTDSKSFRAARLVSHHLRLLGLLYQNNLGDWLILVDYDDTN